MTNPNDVIIYNNQILKEMKTTNYWKLLYKLFQAKNEDN